MIDNNIPPPTSPAHHVLRKTLAMLAGFAIFVILLLFLYLVWLQYRSHQLWDIVSTRCIPEQIATGTSSSCLQVNLAQHYTVFKDAKGPLHQLLIPTMPIRGIESQALLNPEAENFFQHGWEMRHFLQQQATFPLADRYLAQVINSRYGRTQNQLHIHLACLKPEVYQAIVQQKESIGHQWQALMTALAGRRYIAIKVPVTANPFIALAQYLQAEGDNMDNYGLVRLAPDNGEVILLATRLQLARLSLGSPEELLDFDCKLAQVSE